MMLRTTVRDCLLLNWSLPVAALPPAPSPLSYHVHPWHGEDWVFVSALLYYQEMWRFPPLLYPQFSLAVHVLDGRRVPAFLFRGIFAPCWVAPAARWMAGQPMRSARFRYDRPSRKPESGAWRWAVRRRGSLEAVARRDSPTLGQGPPLGSWPEILEYFQPRGRGYQVGRRGLSAIDVDTGSANAWPLAAEIRSADLLERTMPLQEAAPWPPLHSALLFPEIPLALDLDLALDHEPAQVKVRRQQVPAPG